MKKLLLLLLYLFALLTLVSCAEVDDAASHTHVYTVQKTENAYLASEANCQSPATYYYSCSCGFKGTETFSHGSIAHHYDVQNTAEAYLAKEATCQLPAKYYYSCECGEKHKTRTFSYGTPNGQHDYTVQNPASKYLAAPADCENAATYYYSCKCGAKGEATFSYGSVLHHYTEQNTSVAYLMRAATCQQAAVYYYSCECGAKSSTIFSYGDADESKHTPDASGYCTLCNHPTKGTEGVLYDLSHDGTYALVIGYTGSSKKVIIADTYQGVPVTTIYEYVFSSKNITSVIIPDSVISIEQHAFSSCKSLTSVKIGNGVTTIGWSAFSGCSALTSITIPDSVTTIRSCAFYSCTNLRNVTIGSGLINIEEDAFSNCNALYREYEFGIYVGDTSNPYAILIGVTNRNFQTYKIHESTKIITSYVFYSCSRLYSITIPTSVTSISGGAFYACNGPTIINYRGSEAEWTAISKPNSWNSSTGPFTITYNYQD